MTWGRGVNDRGVNERELPSSSADAQGGKGAAAKEEVAPLPAAGGRWLCGVPQLDSVLRASLELPTLLRHSSSLCFLLCSQALAQFGNAAVLRGASGYFVSERGSSHEQVAACTGL